MLMYTARVSNGLQGRVPYRGGIAAAADRHGLPTINSSPTASLEELSSMRMTSPVPNDQNLSAIDNAAVVTMIKTRSRAIPQTRAQR